MGRRAHFVERCPQFFSVFEVRIVANKKLTPKLKDFAWDRAEL